MARAARSCLTRGGVFQDPDHSNGTPTRNSELIIAIDPLQVGGLEAGGMYNHCELLYERILRTGGTQLPSTGRHCGSERLAVREVTAASGVELPATLVAEVERLIDDPDLITNEYMTDSTTN